MFERSALTPRNMLALALIFLMAVPMAPAGALGRRRAGDAGPRAVTDDSSDLIVPAGETYELFGCHTYTNSVQINGTLKVKPYDGVDETTGTLWLQGGWISIGPGGAMSADGRGYGGGGGASERTGTGGSGGQAREGRGRRPRHLWWRRRRREQRGRRRRRAAPLGTAGAPGTETGGGKGGDVTKGNYVGGAGGTGFGGGGGGGAGMGAAGPDRRDGGGGGGGGSGGTTGIGYTTGGNGAGPAKGPGRFGARRRKAMTAATPIRAATATPAPT